MYHHSKKVSNGSSVYLRIRSLKMSVVGKEKKNVKFFKLYKNMF